MSQGRYTSPSAPPPLGRRGPMARMGMPVQKAKDSKKSLK